MKLGISLEDLGELYHDYSFFCASGAQKPGIFKPNQKAKEPILRSYISLALAKSAGPASDRHVSFVELFCADGFYAMLARKLGASRSIGVDNDRDGHFAVAPVIAGRLGLGDVEFVKMDVNEALGSLQEVDVVANVGGLYHVANPEEILDGSYRLAKQFLVIQTVVSLASHDPHHFVAPAPGWTWGCRYSRESFDATIRKRGWKIVDHHFNELTGNDRPEDRGSVYYLIAK